MWLVVTMQAKWSRACNVPKMFPLVSRTPRPQWLSIYFTLNVVVALRSVLALLAARLCFHDVSYPSIAFHCVRCSLLFIAIHKAMRDCMLAASCPFPVRAFLRFFSLLKSPSHPLLIPSFDSSLTVYLCHTLIGKWTYTGGRGGHTWQVHCEFFESF